MSYYGPASQRNARKTSRTNSGRLPQFDYSKQREHNHAAMKRAWYFNRQGKRLRRTVRIVPWRDERELQEVGKGLFSILELEIDIPNRVEYHQQGSPPPTTTSMHPEEAFAMISVWKSRLTAIEGLAHAIESTAALAQVYWRDSQRRMQRLTTTMRSSRKITSNGSGVSVAELRLAYSAAIVRCINGFADSLQQQRAMAASVANLCGKLGIPSWLVDTRHESSHNALPNLEVLRLSASTLLEFMRSEYWIPRCTEWNNIDNETSETSTILNRKILTTGEIETPNVEQNDLDSENSKNDRCPVDLLLEYKARAFEWGTNRVVGAKNNAAKSDNNTPLLPTHKQSSKRKKKSSSVPQKTIFLPYDPLFGEVDTLGTSDDDSSDVTDDEFNEGNKIKKPVVNSIWGSSIGTNTNRYMLLEIPKKKKKDEVKKKQQQKSIPNNPKKRKGEKSPTDCAKLFVQSVSSLQEGYAVAIQYLIWGGVGGAPMGRGVLIPDSETSFPATSHGVAKCRQRYSPLIHVISRTWPGFAACMITHLVDCVLSIGDSSILYENDTDRRNRRQELGEAPTRKLFFLSSWIRLLLSQRFVAALDRGLSIKNISSKSSNPLELPLAQLNHLECLGYPLNSLLDRCRRFNNHSHISNDSDGNTNYSDPIVPGRVLTKTIRAIILSIETILGEKKTNKFGYSEPTASLQDIQYDAEPSMSKRKRGKNNYSISKVQPEINSGAMSLDEMEKMLLLDNYCNKKLETGAESNSVGRNGILKESHIQLAEETYMGEMEPPIRRPAWIRCESWDACSMGTLPGYPY